MHAILIQSKGKDTFNSNAKTKSKTGLLWIQGTKTMTKTNLILSGRSPVPDQCDKDVASGASTTCPALYLCLLRRPGDIEKTKTRAITATASKQKTKHTQTHFSRQTKFKSQRSLYETTCSYKLWTTSARYYCWLAAVQHHVSTDSPHTTHINQHFK